MTTAKHDHIQQMTDTALEQLSHALAEGKSEALNKYLATMSKFYRYSFGNQMLIAFQRPDATFVAGFTTWRTKFNRFVKKGEKGILILAPVIHKIAATETTSENATAETEAIGRMVNVRTAHVFDVSQTEGDPLPELTHVTGDPAGRTQKLKELITVKGIALQYVDHLGGALGMSTGQQIQIVSNLEPAVEFSVLVHELAHELLHKGDRRSETTKKIRETEAEAVAYVVGQAVGLQNGSASSDYIQLYSGDKETLAESLQFIRNVSTEIITALS